MGQQAHPFFLGSSWMARTTRSFLVAGAMTVLVKAWEAAPAGRQAGRQCQFVERHGAWEGMRA
jgi:hypothetical protein